MIRYKTNLKSIMLASVVSVGCLVFGDVQAQVLQGFEAPPIPSTTVETLPDLGVKTAGKLKQVHDGSLLFSDLTTPAIDLDRQEILARSSNTTVLTLAPKERAIARAAWSYIDNNMDPKTGLVRAVENSFTVSLWDFGNTIAAIESARSLNLISKADYDQKIRRIVRSLAEVETYAGLPNHLIDIRTGRHPEVGENQQQPPKGFQSKDLGYLLMWLEATKRNTPYLANPIDSLVGKWNFCRLREPSGEFANEFTLQGKAIRQPVQGLGYDAFTRKAFNLWGFSTHLTSVEAVENTQVLGIDFPLPITTNQNKSAALYTETFLLDGLMFGWDQPNDISSELLEFTDGWRAEIAHRMYQLQYERYQQTGILTARASHYDRGEKNQASYVNQPLIDQGIGFRTTDTNQIPKPELASISTKAAFSTWTLWDTAYSRLLLEAVADTYDRDRGFPEGLYENYGGQIDTYSLDTNAAVLMALAFKHQGVLIPKQNQQAPSMWDKLRQNAKAQRNLCLPKPRFGSDLNLSYDPYQSLDNQRAESNSSNSMTALSYQYCDVSRDISQNFGAFKPKTVSNCRFFGQ